MARVVLARYGKELTHEAHKAALGKRPLECWQAVSKLLDMPVDGAALLAETEPMLTDRYEGESASHDVSVGMIWQSACLLPVFAVKSHTDPQIKSTVFGWHC